MRRGGGTMKRTKIWKSTSDTLEEAVGAGAPGSGVSFSWLPLSRCTFYSCHLLSPLSYRFRSVGIRVFL